MRRLLVLLTLTALACGFFTPTPSPLTATPLPTDSATAAPSPTFALPTASPVPTNPPATDATRFPDPAGFEWRQVAQGLFDPTDIKNAGDGSGRIFIVEQNGRIRILQNGQTLDPPFLDIIGRVGSSGNEQGLLGIAFDPDFTQNQYYYVNYTDLRGNTVIARFTASGNTTDPGSEKILLRVDQPFPNHNGGSLAFGPDGYLYIGLGDGGSGGDPIGNGQSLGTLLGKILRIDVHNGDPYGIPIHNPFANGGGRPEIWAYGLRNPWRFSFDSKTGDLWIGDVGQNAYEEIDFVPAGTPGGINFGWNRYEGLHDFGNGAPLQNAWPPVLEYGHQDPIGGCAVTGGDVYRGAMAEWRGIYFYGDFCTGNVWAVLHLVNDTETTFNSERLFQVRANITTFGVDEAGELYLADRGGVIYQLARK